MPNRPKKPLDTPAQTSEDSTVSGKLRPMVNLEALQNHVASLVENEAPKLYIYRTDPPIKLPGDKTNIDSIGFPLPNDVYGYVKRTHGGGGYKLLLNAENRVPSAIAECRFEVPLQEADPILDIRTLVRGKTGTEQLIRRWKREGKLAELPDGELMEIVPGQGPQQPQATGSSNAVVERFMVHAIDKAMEPKEDRTLETIRLMKELQPTAPATNPAEVTLITFVMEELRESRRVAAELRQQMYESKSGRATGGTGIESLLSAVPKIKSLMDSLGIRMGGEQPQSIVAQISEAITKLGPPLIGAYSMANGGAAILPGLAGAPPAPPPAGTTPAPQQPNAQAVESYRLARQVLVAIQQQRAGDEFATSFIDIVGPEAYQRLREVGPETMAAMLRTFPDLALEFDKHGDALKTFLEAFVHAYDEEEPADAPAAAQVA